MTTPRAAAAAVSAIPGALVVYFAFNAGGFFVGAQGVIAVLLLLVLAVRVAVAEDPGEGFSAALLLAAGALALFAVWTLASTLWSDAPSRALLEFDRALLYLATLVLFGSFAHSPARVGWMIRWTALGILVVCAIALITRTLPDLWSVAPNTANDRLSYPVTYWNALGLLSTAGIVLCLHLTCSIREPGPIRVLAAAALPVLTVTLLFTFSRGAIAAALLALPVYLLLARPKAVFGGVLAALPCSAAALAAAYGADQLATRHPTTEAAIAQGHRVALVLAVCTVVAALLRWALLRIDGRVLLGGPSLPPRVAVGAASAIACVAVTGAVVADAPAAIGHQYDRFVARDSVEDRGDFRQRLTDPSNSERLNLWRADLDAFRSDALTGQGAGAFQTYWLRHRPGTSSAVDGHSLYLEVLGELGVVGLLLLAGGLSALLVALARRCRGPNGSIYAAVLTVAVVWALHAGIDWDWEMPVVTAFVFALAGAAVAGSSVRARLIRRPPRFARVVVALGLLVLAVTPARIAYSQSRLNSSVSAFKGGDCPRAIDSALDSASALGSRPEPYEVLGYCDSRLGLHRLAIDAMRAAVARDSDNWEFRYGLAVVRAAAGRDPRPAALAALRLNPHGFLAQDLARRFRASNPVTWRKRARLAPLPGGL